MKKYIGIKNIEFDCDGQKNKADEASRQALQKRQVEKTMENNCKDCIHKGKWIEQEPCRSCKGSGKKKEMKESGTDNKN